MKNYKLIEEQATQETIDIGSVNGNDIVYYIDNEGSTCVLVGNKYGGYAFAETCADFFSYRGSTRAECMTNALNHQEDVRVIRP